KSGLVWRVVAAHGDLVPLANEPVSGRIISRLDPRVSGVKDWTEEWIGFATGAFDARASRAGATPLTAWIGDVERRAAHADLAAVPAFSTRRGLPEGDIHRNDMFGIYPYENTLKAIRISGAQLRAYLEQVATYYFIGTDGKLAVDARYPGYNFDVIIGADYDYDLGRPAGQRVIRLEARGRAVAPTDSFTLALSNYRQTGGGGFTMLAGARVTWEQPEGAGVRDLLEAAAKADTLRPERYARESWRILPRDREDQARAFAGAPLRARPSAPRDTTVLRILALNDLHGQLDPRVWPWSNGRPVGGLSNIKTLMDSLVAECNCPVVKLDAGDEFQGTLGSNITFGRPVVDAFNRIGIQAAATGNHDYDWGTDSLQHRIAESHYPWLAANVVDSATGRRPDWIKSWTMLTAGPLKVAVIGYAHPATPSMTFRAAVAGLKFVGGPAPIQAAIAEARAQHPDFVVLLAHYGGDCHDACGGEIFALVDSLGAGAVDAVIGGHSHGSVLGRSGTGVPILQGGSSGRAIAQIDFVRTVVGAREVHTALDTVWADKIRPDRGVDDMLARFRPAVDSLAHRRVVDIAIPLNRRGNDNALGRLIADAYRNALRADMALVNNGGIRRDLPAGALDFGTAYELMPFGNRLVKVTLPGSAVKLILENVLGGGSPNAHFSGGVVRWDSTAARGRRVKEVRFLDGRKLEDKKQYTLAVNDFMAQGAEEYQTLPRYPQEALGLLDLDAFIAYLRRLPQPVQPPGDPRFVTR
ncbi:MAG: 5'-nucleotidase C-terminal domain-containing protein, partial [Gemmatimonadetes bacterium]|nr:5'-nucleotidase C-terminal domain-containing protein [Gemmatimonadota bacterium]